MENNIPMIKANNTQKTYNTLDMLKLILAFFVMTIHSGVDKTILSPILRIAVPTFFIISSFLFFKKQTTLSSNILKKQALFQMVKRNLLLYLFWTILQSPIYFFLRGYYRYGVFSGALFAIRDILTGKGFTGAWYITALVIGIVIIWFLSKKISPLLLVFIMIPFYFLCCLNSNYYNLLEENSPILTFFNQYQKMTGGNLYTTFFAALLWIAIGKFFAEKKPTIKQNAIIALLVLSSLLIGLERYFIVRLTLSITDDCYFSLILLCPMIFLLAIENIRSFSSTIPIRELSTIIYVTHACVERIVGYILKTFSIPIINNNLVKIVISFLIILLLCKILVYLKERKEIPLAKYSY